MAHSYSSNIPADPQDIVRWHCSACGYSGQLSMSTPPEQLAEQIAVQHDQASPDCTHPDFQILLPGERPGIRLRAKGDDGERMHVIGAVTYHVAAWSPGDVMQGDPMTQVHVLLEVPSLNSHILLRLKSRRAADELIDLLIQYRDHVWPEARGD